MSATIRGDFNGSPEYHIGYAGFFAFRRTVAYIISEEFGEHYNNLLKYPFMKQAERTAFSSRSDVLIEKYKVPVGVWHFLFQPDCDGTLTPQQCSELEKYIEKIAKNARFGYIKDGARKATNRSLSITAPDFLKLLKKCKKEGKNLVWF